MKKIVVGLSGGVDSSTTAFLLKKQGYEVVGISLKFTDIDSCDINTQVCCSDKDILDAKKVAEFLEIPHYVINWKDFFEKKVIDYFIEGYKSGITPNPCSICNRDVKTGLFAKYVKSLGFDFLATGHYIKIDNIENIGKVVRRGKDKQKDQSYFMALVEREVFEYILFPLGDLTKEEVRKIALENNIPVSKKDESFEICFTGGKSPKEFFESKNIKSKPGDIVHISGKVLGKHTGIEDYTIGQRRGLNISWKEPLYVIEKDARNNIIVVGEKEYLYTDRVVATDINILVPLEYWKNIKVQGRYKQNPVDIKDFEFDGKNLTVYFKELQPKFAPGQILAIYQDDILLGGGIIN